MRKFLIWAVAAALASVSSWAQDAATDGTIPYYNPCTDLSTLEATYGNYNSAGTASRAWTVTSNAFRCQYYSTDLTCEIWTKALQVEQGKIYKLTFYAGPNSYYGSAPCGYEVALYETAEKTGNKTIIGSGIFPAKYTANSTNLVTIFFAGDTEKPYLGIAGTQGKQSMYYWIDEISIVEGDQEVPGPATDFAVDCAESLQGIVPTVSFTLPAVNAGGVTPITKLDKAVLKRGDTVLQEWTSQQPGATLTYTETTPLAYGQYTYSVVCSNNDNEGMAITYTLDAGRYSPTQNSMQIADDSKPSGFFGKNYNAYAYYIPGQGIGIKFTNAPASAYLPLPEDSDKKMYVSITRLTDGKLLVQDYAVDDDFIDTDVDEDNFHLYQYKVDFKWGKMPDGTFAVDLATYQNKYSSVVGINYTTETYAPTMTANDLYYSTVIDNDGDNITWSQVSGRAAATYGATQFFQINASKTSDDWIISPGVQLEKGKIYRIDVTALNYGTEGIPVQFAVSVGNTNTVEAMTTEVISTTKHLKNMGATYSGYYTATDDGNIFIGVRAMEETTALGISAIKVTETNGTLPSTIENVNLTYSETENGNATLSFTAPSTDIQGNSVTLTKIEILKNGEPFKTIDDPVPGQEYTEQVTFTPGEETVYTLTPYSAAGAGISTNVNVMIITPPYVNQFNSQSDMAGFTSIDALDTGNAWAYIAGPKAVAIYPSNDSAGDTYFITPPIALDNTSAYRLDFQTWMDYADTNETYNNGLEVLLLSAPTADADAVVATILPKAYVRGDHNSKEAWKEWITVKESGQYYIAWHATCEVGKRRQLFIDEIELSAPIPGTYPGGVENLKITPDQKGGIENVITFTIPTKTIIGEELTGNVVNTYIYRDNILISTQGSKAAGTEITFTDNQNTTYSGTAYPLTEGVHNYTITCYGTDSAPSRDVDMKAYTGLNKPSWLPSVKAVENPDKYGEVTITWEKPETDIDGYPLNTDEIYYTVGRLIYNPVTGSTTEQVYEEGDLFADGLSYTVDTKAATQQFMKFYVDSYVEKHDESVHPDYECAGGIGAYYENVTPYMAVGAPYTLPFTESFPNSNSSHNMMGQELDGIAQWGFNNYNRMDNVYPVDGDNGLAIMEAAVYYGSAARLYTGRIDLSVENPVITMYIYNLSKSQFGDINEFAVSVRVDDGEFEVVESKTVDQWTDGAAGWNKISIDLSKYAGKVVYIGFEGIGHIFYGYDNQEEPITFIHIDNVTVDAQADTDASIKLVKNTTAYVGAEHTVSATVKNLGGKDLENATVTFLLDDTEVGTVDVPTVAAGEMTVVDFTNVIGRDALGEHTYSAVLNAEGDTDLLDNKATGEKFVIEENEYPTVENLEGYFEDNAVSLTWDEPTLPETAEEITDDFESYPSWSTIYSGIGNYTLVDRDGLPIGGVQDASLPVVAGTKQSFSVWDFSYTDESGNAIFGNDSHYTAHSGDKCLLSVNVGSASSGKYVDDLLISPLLTGEAQTIKLWAKAYDDEYSETFYVYYSKDGIDFSDFENNVFQANTVGGTWTEFSYDLPEGAKYFAVRHYSIGGYFLFVDDITYTPVGNETLQLKGYNVYREGSKLNTSIISEKTWIDADATPETDVTYSVTAVYDRGESQAATVTVSTLGVADVTTANISVEAANGEIVITGAEGNDYSVVNAAGIVVASDKASTVTRVAVAQGLYVVNVNGTPYKVVVK